MTTNCRCFMKNYCRENFTIEVKNNGFFDARVSVNYFNNGQFIADSSGVLHYRYLYTNSIPPTAYNIVVRVYNLSVTPTQVMCQRFYQVPQHARILLWGTPTATNCTDGNLLCNYRC